MTLPIVIIIIIITIINRYMFTTFISTNMVTS
jgi:hypothetical protein